jgi:hypothetical protein
MTDQDANLTNIITVSTIKKYPESTTIHEHRRFYWKVMRALTEVLKSGIQECFQKVYERWKSVTLSKGKYFEGNVMYRVRQAKFLFGKIGR